MIRPNYSSNRSDISLSRELRKDLMNKHAFGTFSVADFDATARTFWDNGYQSVTSIRDMDANQLCARTKANIPQKGRIFSPGGFLSRMFIGGRAHSFIKGERFLPKTGAIGHE